MPSEGVGADVLKVEGLHKAEVEEAFGSKWGLVRK